MGNAPPSQLRTALLDQLRYLQDEVAAMEPLIGRLQDAEARAGGRGRSVKECYGALVAWDRHRVIPELRRLIGAGVSGLVGKGTDWNAVPLMKIMDEVNAARGTAVELAVALDAAKWTEKVSLDGLECDVYGLLHRTIQHDVDMLRTIAEQLHRSW